MDFFTLFSLGLYGNAVNKYNQPVKYENDIGNIPRYYDNIYNCNQINNNRTKVFLKASNNYLKSLEPNTNIINKIWRLQKNDNYNQIQQNDVYNQIQQNDVYNQIQQNDVYVLPGQSNELKNELEQSNELKNELEQREPFIGDVKSFFDKLKNYSFLFFISLIILSCFCCFCM
jgi:hypothetical protein